jgi:hypothetical protein
MRTTALLNEKRKMKNEKWATAATLTSNVEQAPAVAHFSFFVFHF